MGRYPRFDPCQRSPLRWGASIPIQEGLFDSVRLRFGVAPKRRKRYCWNKRTADGLKVGLAYFNQATDEDAKYPQAYSDLGHPQAMSEERQYAVMTLKEGTEPEVRYC